VFVFLFTHLQATLILSTSVFALILSVVLSPAPYALVLEGLGPVQAILAGVDFFKGNKFDVLILCAVTSALSLLIFFDDFSDSFQPNGLEPFSYCGIDSHVSGSAGLGSSH